MPRQKKSSTSKKAGSKKSDATVPPLPGSKEDRRAKLEIFLKDYDIQVDMRIQEFAKLEKEQLNKLDQEFRVFKMKMPQQINDMKLKEFMEVYNGDVATCQRILASADDSVDDLLDIDADLNPKRAADANGAAKRGSNEENEAGDSVGPLPGSKFATPAHHSKINPAFVTPAPCPERRPLTACTPSFTRAPRRSELDNPIHSKLVLFQESKKGSPLAQDLSQLGVAEMERVQAQLDQMIKMKKRENESSTSH